MALINCKIVNSSGVEGSVSVVSEDAATDIPTQSLYIIPDQGYVVSASSFSHTTLPTGIESITFTDTATAGEADNTIKVDIDITDTYSITDNITIPIGVDGEAVDANLINVVPHIAHDATIGQAGMVTTVDINKLTETNPPTINNIDSREYDPVSDSDNNYSAYIDYLPCTIKPDEWTKVGTISVQTGQYPATGSRQGWFHMKDTPYLRNLTPSGNGLPLYELIQTGTQTDTASGATKQIDFDIMFKDSSSHNLIGGEWPFTDGATSGNYYHIASREDNVGVKLEVPRPALMWDIISDEVIEVINIGDYSATIDDIEANEFQKPQVTKSYETAADPLQVSYLNPGNPYMPWAVGNINKVTTEEPNPISIQGTPGATFTLGLEKVVAGGGPNVDMGLGGTNDAVAGKWATSSDGGSTYSAKEFTIPASGTWVGAITDIAQIASGDSAEEYLLTVEAKNGSTISTAAATSQSEGTITAEINNTAVYKYTQPCSDVNVKVVLEASGTMGSTALDSNSNSVKISTPTVGEYGVDADDHIILDVSGFGGSTHENNSHYKRAKTVASFTATREGNLYNGTAQKAVLTGYINFVKYPITDLTITWDWDDFMEIERDNNHNTLPTSDWDFHDTYKGQAVGNKLDVTSFVTAGLTTDDTEVGASVWTSGAGSTAAEFSIQNVTLTINPT